MKRVTMLVLAAIAVAALMAFVGAGSASAAGVLCSTQSAPCTSKWPNGTTLTFSLASGGSVLWKETGAGGASLDTCKESTISGQFTNGSSTANANGALSTLSWSNCTFTTATVSGFAGGLEVVSAGSHKGTVKASAEIRVTIKIPLFGTCVYGVTAGTTIGTLTEGNPATFDLSAVALKGPGSGFACPDTGNWTATYTQTAPSGTALSVESS